MLNSLSIHIHKHWVKAARFVSGLSGKARCRKFQRLGTCPLLWLAIVLSVDGATVSARLPWALQ